MRRVGSLIILFVTFALTTGCATLNPGNAVNSSNIQSVDFSKIEGMKRGEACTTVVLGLFSDGSSLISDAAKAGGIKTVELVEYKVSNNPIFSKRCTIAFGR